MTNLPFVHIIYIYPFVTNQRQCTLNSKDETLFFKHLQQKSDIFQGIVHKISYMILSLNGNSILGTSIVNE